MSEAQATVEQKQVTSEAPASTGHANSEPPKTGRPGMIQLSIKEKLALQAAYMPFIDGGGLFIPISRAAHIGDEVYLILSLLDEEDKQAITGSIVWITPTGVPGRQQGFGIQFAKDEAGEQARNRIETMIGGIKAPRATHTI